MHQVFCISEIAERFVENLVQRSLKQQPEDDSTRLDFIALDLHSYYAIRSLGMASRVFREPCLDAIWHTQISLVPLLRSVGAIESKDGGLPSFGFVWRKHNSSRIIGAEDLPNLLLYSSRIKTLHLSAMRRPMSLEREGSALPHTFLLSDIIFPSLRYLSCDMRTSGPPDTRFVLTTMGKSLLNLSLKFTTASETDPDAFESTRGNQSIHFTMCDAAFSVGNFKRAIYGCKS
ncbi:hypothetical protein BXZ70DRAFT_489009 [Cristinia sonorae]|uniref:Uncharacterized protein n=1 Tax=Cristinia sonorae TaxID=1940300 RepID=A0A8K0XLI0_9AGAR|nr:hypothetical protein BXZ70DRAFT_489009 [Cristinia sonorae]